MSWLDRLDRLIGRVIAAAQWLALPLILLLFLQWPLRDIVRSYSREAKRNVLGQIIFALYVAISVTAATRARTLTSPPTRWRNATPRAGAMGSSGLAPLLASCRGRSSLCSQAQASSFRRCAAWKLSQTPTIPAISSSRRRCAFYGDHDRC